MVRQYELESDVVRRHKVRQWREAEEFWRGNQNIFWNEQDSRWHTPFNNAGQTLDDARADYCMNYYRAWGMSVMAALTQSPAKISYRPESAEREEDVATAKASSRIEELVARNNDMDHIRTEQAHNLWTQGMFAAYVRFVVDGGLYGYDEEPVEQGVSREIAGPRAVCQQCGAETPALSGEVPPSCPSCGAPLGPESFMPGESITVPEAVATKKVPRGAEKIDIYGPLFFKLPPQARSQRGCYYLILVEEQHQASLRAAYPDKAAKIGDQLSAGAEDGYERIVRLTLADAQGTWNSLPMSSLITYKRAWLRPEAFWSHADPEERQQLLDLYPDGCMVAFAGDVFLEARPEKLDDYWVVCKGMPSVGIYSDALGYDAIPIQRQINDCANILAEHRELASAPPIFYDAGFISGQALEKKRMQPASYVPIYREAGGQQKVLSDLVFQPAFHVDPELWQDGERLAEVGQFITGALPTIFGGGSPNLKTASAYAQAREQAMGRLALVWKDVREAQAKIMTAAIGCFKRNRMDDVELSRQDKDGNYKSDYIRLNDVRGSAVASPSADEDFPQTWGARRDTLMQLLQSKDPEILAVLGAPVNLPVIKHLVGMPDLVDPADDNRAKQFREIDQLLDGQPIQGPNGPVPTVAPEPQIDNHPVHIEVIRDWAVSNAGLEAKAVNPGGYANVLAHLLAHMTAQQEMAADQGVRQREVQQLVQAAGNPNPSAQPAAANAANGAPPPAQPQPQPGPQTIQ